MDAATRNTHGADGWELGLGSVASLAQGSEWSASSHPPALQAEGSLALMREALGVAWLVRRLPHWKDAARWRGALGWVCGFAVGAILSRRNIGDDGMQSCRARSRWAALRSDVGCNPAPGVAPIGLPLYASPLAASGCRFDIIAHSAWTAWAMNALIRVRISGRCPHAGMKPLAARGHDASGA